MKLFLTGGTGFLGMNIAEQWKESSYLYSRGEDTSCILEYNPDYIIHCAAEIKDEATMFDSNVVLTHEILLKTTNLLNLKAMIFIGTSSEYGLKDHPIVENDVLEPFHLYASTKGAASLLCLAYAKAYEVPVMIARPFSLYGKYEPRERLIPTAIKHVKAGWEIEVAPGHHDFIHIDDFIRGLFMMLKKPKTGEIFNFGTGIQRSNDEVVDVIEDAVGRKVKRVPVKKMRSYDTDNWVCDYKKAHQVYGWKPKITFKQGIRKLTRKENKKNVFYRTENSKDI